MADQQPDARCPRRGAGNANVALLPRGAQALAALQARSGRKQADVVNKCLPIYEFIDQAWREGKDLVVQQPQGGEYTVVFL